MTAIPELFFGWTQFVDLTLYLGVLLFLLLVITIYYSRLVTKHRAESQYRQYQHEFQQIVAEMSSRFVAAQSSDHEQAVHQTLDDLGRFFAVDRTYIFRLDRELGLLDNTFEWCAQDILPQQDKLQRLPEKSFPWWMEKLRAFEVIHIPMVEEMPAEASAEKETLQDQGIQSVLVVPMVSKGELAGFLGFDSVGNVQVWNDSDLSLLKVAAEIIQNAMDRHSMEEVLREQSIRDPLTGLYNRRYLQHLLDTMDDKPLALIMADIDGLKVVNDSFGHQQGDQVLAAAGQAMAANLANGQTAARWGGDEFIIFLPDCSSSEAHEVCRRIRDDVAALEGLPVTLNVSLGSAVRSEKGGNLEDLLKEAEDAMYREKTLHHRSSRSALVRSMRRTLQAKCTRTDAHCQNLQRLADAMAERLELSEDLRSELQLLALLHDLGKVGIPEEILNKPGPLTEEEWTIMRTHAEIGHRIARSSPDLLPVAEAILCHHDWWDGSGYPRGLKGEEIPLSARIIALVDAFDAMTTKRPYRRPVTIDHALTEISQQAGRQFDPHLAAVFLDLIMEQEARQVPS